MRIYLTILLQLVYISCFSANDNTEIGIRKNIFYLEGESILAISNVSLNYERIVLQDQSFRLSDSADRASRSGPEKSHRLDALELHQSSA